MNIYAPLVLDREMILLQLCRWKFHTEKLCSTFYSTELEFFYNNDKLNSLFGPPFGELEETYAFKLSLVKKRVVDFLLAIFELLSLALTVET